MRFPKYKNLDKEEVMERIEEVGERYMVRMQYPIFHVPAPFRDVVRMRMTRFYGSFQPCMKFYKDFFKCAYEVGRQLEYRECWKEFCDMKECEGLYKTKSRVNLIDNKRHREGLDYLEQPPRHLFEKPYQTFKKETKL